MADMTNVAEQLEAIDQRVFSSLKDFQKATVSRIEKLYIGGQRRVLVSDEVGLGKTLIARGVIAKVAKIQKNEGDDLFKVVYVCSNGAIADQNLRKLRITREAKTESVFTSRLSMQHLTIYKRDNDPDLHRRYIQLIPLTPDTSFRVSSGRGAVGERALMFALLKRIPDLETYQDELEAMMMHGARKSWPGVKKDYEAEAVRCDEMSNGRYFSEMIAKLDQELRFPDPVRPNVYEEILPLCEEIRKNPEAVKQCVPVISRLRLVFARISLDKLEPDLVIMDEFQRFRYLLEASKKQNDSETGMLAYKFFHAEKVRMLLLSATPYKMYSTMEEIDETNVHHDAGCHGWIQATDDSYTALSERFVKLWKQIASRFADMGDRLVFEAFNEMLDGQGHWTQTENDSAYDIHNRWNQLFVNVVRSSGGNNATRVLSLQTYSAGHSARTLAAFRMPEDTVPGRIILQVHNYDPQGFCWLRAENHEMRNTWGTEADLNQIDTLIADLSAFAEKHQAPLIIGEFGSEDKQNTDDRLRHAAYVVGKAWEKGIVCFWWDCGHFALFDRNSEELIRPEIADALQR